MSDTSRLKALQRRCSQALRNGQPSQPANDPSVTPEKPRSDGIWKSLVGTIVGGFISSATAYCTNIQGYGHQAQAAQEEKHDQSLKLRAALLAELQFERDQLDWVVNKSAATFNGKLSGFILLPSGEIFQANIAKLDLLPSVEATKVYSAEKYYQLASDQMVERGDEKKGFVELFVNQSKAQGFRDSAAASLTISDQAIALLKRDIAQLCNEKKEERASPSACL